MRKKVLMLPIFILLVGVAVTTYSITWLDKQVVPQILNSRIYLLFVAKTYPLLPVIDRERDVVRTIKLANLVATSQIHRKSVTALANDFALSYQMLSGLLDKKDLPDQTAYLEVALERLILFNRMQALAVMGGRRLDATGVADPVAKGSEFAFDQEKKIAAGRELNLLRILANQEHDGSWQTAPHSQVEATNSLHIGLGQCAVRNERGADGINNALSYFGSKSKELIYLINRNIDHPLIAAAQSFNNAGKCSFSINQLKKIIGN